MKMTNDHYHQYPHFPNCSNCGGVRGVSTQSVQSVTKETNGSSLYKAAIPVERLPGIVAGDIKGGNQVRLGVPAKFCVIMLETGKNEVNIK